MPTCDERDEMRRLLVEVSEQISEKDREILDSALLRISQTGTYPRPMDPLIKALAGFSQAVRIQRLLTRQVETGESVDLGNQVLAVRTYDFTTLMVEEDRLFLFVSDDKEA